MKIVRIALFASLAACSASAAWAQYGLYGSPETLQVSQQEMAQAYATPTNYPTTATPMVQPVPGQAYQPQQTPYGYRYPVQRSAVAMYQPYQPGARYRYPNPYAQAPVRTAAVEQPTPLQPIPNPSGQPAAGSPAPQGSGMMNQMLTEQDYGYYGYNNGCGGAYRGVLGRFDQAACGPYCGDGGYDACYTPRCCPWYASVSALVMSRSQGRRLWTSYATNEETNQLTETDFGMAWKGGGEIRFGRRFCCGCVPYALEATYWTTEAFTGYRSTTNPNAPYTVSTPLIISPMTFGGVAAQNWFDGAAEHRLWRRDEFHNIEVNLLREQLAWACDSPWDIGWSVGIRYFRFQEFLQFGSLMNGYNWGDNGGACEAYLSENITNNLVGVQFGFDAAYNTCGGVRLFITPKVGIYNNFMEQTFQARTGSGVNGVGPYGSFPVNSSRNGLSFLTQIDVGADWQFSRNWSARVGYRVLAVTGMGLADDQFPQYMVDTPEIANIQHYSSLVLHGAFLGLTYNF